MAVSCNKRHSTVGRLIARLAIAFVACLVLFPTAKFLVGFIPESAMQESLEESAAMLAADGGDSRMLLVGEMSTSLDNYTTAIMLSTCAQEHASGFEAVFGDYNYFDVSDNRATKTSSLIVQLSGVADDDPGWRSYARYWHGYIVVLKPLLVFLNLNQIRMLFAMAISALLLACSCILARLRGPIAGVLFGLAFFAVNYLVAAISLSLAFTFAIALAATLYVLVKTDRGGGTAQRFYLGCRLLHYRCAHGLL